MKRIYFFVLVLIGIVLLGGCTKEETEEQKLTRLCESTGGKVLTVDCYPCPTPGTCLPCPPPECTCPEGKEWDANTGCGEAIEIKECSNDNECFVGGCSNQVCSNKPNVITM